MASIKIRTAEEFDVAELIGRMVEEKGLKVVALALHDFCLLKAEILTKSHPKDYHAWKDASALVCELKGFAMDKNL